MTQVAIDGTLILVAHRLQRTPGHRRQTATATARKPLRFAKAGRDETQVGRVADAPGTAETDRHAGQPLGLGNLLATLGEAGGVAIVAAADRQQVTPAIDQTAIPACMRNSAEGKGGQ